MVTRFKKTRKDRGNVSMGYGRVGRHHKHDAGRGNAGTLHHHRILMDRFHPGYFGKLGMRHFHYKRNAYYCPKINVDTLWSLLPEEARVKREDGQVPVIDCTRHGFFKVLGRGGIPPIPVVVKARFFSSRAERKIKLAGGACILDA
eukprot:TRINITY_DN137_c0_g1_i2.p2 TRINITY_DN137_c0_g1~~TRINITY_DN137_c0_g1_i2.p2  ORF type:complete len:146 (+),score=17.87 TRINITY_DN137_c0_g1_i2:8-445(+)